MIWLEFLFTTIFAFVHSIKAQLSTNEVLKSVSQCNLNADLSLDCGTNAVIAVHSLLYAFNVTCEATCCQYSTTDCFVHAESNDVKDVRRTCAGRKSCTVSISTDKIDFTTCSLGVKQLSYVFLQYYCIAETRIQSICSNGQLHSSANNPLYLTNEGYPAVTTGAITCSCSVELFSCNSNINLYINDADLYSDTNNCKQNITINDQDNQTLTTIGCEDHYGNQLETVLLDSHYVKIDFTSNSTENLEGYLFVGFDSSVPDVSFRLTCSSQPETWCAGCRTVPTTNNANVTLNKDDDVSFEATANVTCDSGYETNTSTLTCQANGTWSTTECTAKRCGTVPIINNGNVKLNKENDDSFGATGNVTCDSGFETDKSTITCQANGTWSSPECTEKPACAVDQWRCDNGDCIQKDLKCDNVPDCADDSDEKSCSAQICPEGMKACPHSDGSSVCVNDRITCDCGSVPSIDNGDVSLNGNSIIGAVADVTCNEGYNPSNPNVTCLKTGSWEIASCSPEDCGSLPSLSFGHYQLVNGNSTFYGASAKVVCDSEYTAETSTIKCQSSGQWETTVCHKIDCGPLPSISFGQYQLVNASRTVFGASAKVVCDPGYTSSTFNITCQSSGQWESAVCSKETKPPPTPTTKKNSGIYTTTIIVIVIVLVLLAQLLFMCYLQCKIYNIRETASNGHSEIHKRILMTVLGSIPIVGLVPIYLTWKVFYRDVYKVKHNEDHVMKSINGFSNEIYG